MFDTAQRWEDEASSSIRDTNMMLQGSMDTWGRSCYAAKSRKLSVNTQKREREIECNEMKRYLTVTLPPWSCYELQNARFKAWLFCDKILHKYKSSIISRKTSIWIRFYDFWRIWFAKSIQYLFFNYSCNFRIGNLSLIYTFFLLPGGTHPRKWTFWTCFYDIWHLLIPKVHSSQSIYKPSILNYNNYLIYSLSSHLKRC